MLEHLGKEYRLNEADHVYLDRYSAEIIKSWPMQRQMHKRIVELAEVQQQISAGRYKKLLSG